MARGRKPTNRFESSQPTNWPVLQTDWTHLAGLCQHDRDHLVQVRAHLEEGVVREVLQGKLALRRWMDGGRLVVERLTLCWLG
jgi:hypothetical protein